MKYGAWVVCSSKRVLFEPVTLLTQIIILHTPEGAGAQRRWMDSLHIYSPAGGGAEHGLEEHWAVVDRADSLMRKF